MKRRNNVLYLLIAGMACFCIFSVAYAQDDIQWLEHEIFVDRERPAAAFSHTLHADDAGIDCDKCHHVYDESGENVWDDSQESNCIVCHGIEAEGKKMGAMKAFHTNCKGCHEEENAGPLTCGECHPRK